MRAGAGRHGMAVDEEHFAHLAQHGVGEGGEGAVVGQVDLLDTLAGFAEIDAAAIDFLAFRDDAGNGAEAPCHARRTGVGVARQLAGEHAGVELVRFAVEVDVAARHAGAQHGRAVADAGQEKLVDVAVLRLPQGQAREPRRRRKSAGKSLPLWGELKTAGAVHSSGDRISKAGGGRPTCSLVFPGGCLSILTQQAGGRQGFIHRLLAQA